MPYVDLLKYMNIVILAMYHCLSFDDIRLQQQPPPFISLIPRVALCHMAIGLSDYMVIMLAVEQGDCICSNYLHNANFLFTVGAKIKRFGRAE